MSERRRGTVRSALPWLATVALLVALCGLVFLGWRSDMAHDEGPLSLHRTSAVTLPVQDPADTARLVACFGRIDPALRYRIVRDASSDRAASACYRKPGGDGATARVLDARGRQVHDVAVLQRAGAWRWADPMVELRWAAVMSAFALVVLAAIHARVVPSAESMVPSTGFDRVLVCTPVLGLVYLPWLQGLTRARRRTLLLRHLVVYPALLSYGVLGAGLQASDRAADVVTSIMPGAIGIVALRARRGLWPRWGKAWRAPVRVARWTREGSLLPRLRERLRPAGAFVRTLGAMFVEWADPRRGVPAARRGRGVTRGSSPLGEVVEVDLSRLGTATRSLHRLVLGLKISAVLLPVWFLFPGGDDTRFEFTWERILTATLAFIVMQALVIGAQEYRLQPVAAYAYTWMAYAGAALFALELGAITVSEALNVAWVGAYLTLPMLWWRRQSRRLGVSAREAQAVLRVGDLPRDVHPRFALLSPLAVARLVLAAPLLVVGLVLTTANAVAAPAVISDLMQTLSDRIYGLGRRLAAPWLAELVSRDRALALSYVRPVEQGMWTIPVRGNLFKYGNWGPQLVAFDEFVIDRLAAEGLSAPDGPARWGQVVVAVPVGPSLQDADLERVDVAFGASCYLVVFVPATTRVLQAAWIALQQHLRAARELRSLEVDGGLALLLSATAPPILYLGARRDEWHYMSALHEAAGGRLSG